MDRVWRKLDNLRRQSKEGIKRTDCNDLKVDMGGEGSEGVKEDNGKNDIGISNPVMTSFFTGQEHNGVDHFL